MTCQMPNPGLSSSDVTAILAYLETAAAQPSAPATEAASAPAVQGNPEIGKDLFTGVVRFQNGGPPCMACHSVGGIGALGGGQLGPDLTAVVSRYGGAAAVDAFVAGTPTPTMRAVWSKNPLTTEERASVVSFLAQAGVSERPAQAIWQLGGLAVLGACDPAGGRGLEVAEPATLRGTASDDGRHPPPGIRVRTTAVGLRVRSTTVGGPSLIRAK